MKINQGPSRRRDDVKATGRALTGQGRGRVAPRRVATLDVLALEDRRLMALIIPVTSTADSGPNTLRAAVAEADVATRPVEIEFQLPGAAKITLTSGQLELSNTAEPVTIAGPGADELDVDGNKASRVFAIDPMVKASISGLTVSGGYVADSTSNPSDYGGGMDNQGTLTLTGVTFQGNSDWGGAGLDNAGTASLIDCTFTGNVGENGAAVQNIREGIMSLMGCSVTGNAPYSNGVVGNSGYKLTLIDTLVSNAGAAVASVAGEGAYLGTSTTLEDCTISGDGDDTGTGVQGNPRTQTSLVDCTVSGFSEGVGAFDSTMQLNDCTIEGNHGYGAVGSQYGALTMTGCTIAGNSASLDSSFAGGVTSGNGNVATLTDCVISDNQGLNGGGVTDNRIPGLFPNDNPGVLTMTGCTITGNSATHYSRYGSGGRYYGGYGGGLELYSGTAMLTGCTITGNSASYNGGGIYDSGDGSTLDLTDCTVSGNSATGTGGLGNYGQPTGTGGGIQLYGHGTTSLVACTIAANSAGGGSGGGLVLLPGQGSNPQANLVDTIVAGNTGPVGSASDIDVGGQSAVTGNNNLIGTGGSGGLSASDNLLGVADPGLAPLGDYGGPTETIALQPDSPARHAGVAVPGVATDQRGFPLDSPPDIGAFQLQPGPLVVDTAIDGLGSALGQLSLRQAVNLADVLDSGDAITFDKAAFAGKKTITLDDGPLELSNATGPVSIAGTNAARLTISGGGASRVFQVDPGANATLSNLTIAGGVASGNGGGVLNAGTLTLANVVVAGDMASGSGGGVFNSGSLFASNTTVSGDQAADGGGLDNAGTAVILGSSIDGNSATTDGGGIDNSGFLSLGGSDLSANSAGLDGGGLFDIGTATLFFCTVDSNAAAGGGGIFVDPSTTPAVLVGTTVAKNKGGNIVGSVIRL